MQTMLIRILLRLFHLLFACKLFSVVQLVWLQYEKHMQFPVKSAPTTLKYK